MLFCLIIKSIIIPLGIAEAIVLFSLVISVAFKHSILVKNKVNEKEELENKISQLDSKLEDITSSISSLKLDRAIKRGPSNEEKALRRY